ncbi:hypothetical protein D1AOALGA4SA_10836 [Olavius algarvensis Delta 1 endosymbiont]|nr:hypothetical protein D1AOALGA4SA_10836 [Olavius algarvensis Delta 1 endosymbiont]
MRKVFADYTVLMLLAFLTAGGAVMPAPLAAQVTAESKTFVVVGTATVQGEDVSDAREKAISDGLETAVALMTAELLEVEAFVEHFSNLNELLFDRTNAYVSSYKVLTETAREKSYHVIVEASVSDSKISQYLTEAGIIKVQTALPSVLLLIAEQNLADLYPGFWWGVEGADFESVSQAVMVDRLNEAGFSVIDHRLARSGGQINWEAYDKPDLLDQEAAELGALLKADVVIIGESSVAPSTNIMGSAMRSFNGTVAARVIRTASAEPVIDLARTAVAVSEDDISGPQSALEDVGNLAGQALAEALTTAWQEQAGKPSEVLMVIRGTSHLASYVKFRKAMNTISGVEGIQVKAIKPNEATLLVEYKGKAKDLAAALLQQNFVSFGINIFEVTEDMVRVELIPQ